MRDFHFNLQQKSQVFQQFQKSFLYQLKFNQKMNQESESNSAQPKRAHYPKSVNGRIAKIQYEPKFFKSELMSKKYLAFGDSFVNMFLHVQNAFHIKLKGKSIKGLAKTDKEDRKHIQKWAKASKPDTQLVFNFGQVDFNLIRYYKLVHEEDYPLETFQEYVNWIGSLNRKATVIGIFASPIEKQHIISVLFKYNTIQQSEYDEQTVLQEFQKTQQRRQKWNNLIQAACKKNGIRFINLFKHHTEIDQKFLDQNPKTIHLRYLPCIKELQRYITDLKIDFNRALEIQNQYEVVKSQRYEESLKLAEDQKLLESNQTQNQDDDHENDRQNDDQNDKKQGQPDLNNHNENNSDEIEANKQKDAFISSLQIPGILNVGDFFNSLFYPEKENVVQNIVEKVVQKGIQWANPIKFYNQFSTLLHLLRDIDSLKKQEVQITAKASSSFFKHFVFCLQTLYQKNLKTDVDQFQGIENVVNFIMFLSISQEDFDFKLISSKIILTIIKELIVSLFKRLISKDQPKKYKMLVEYTCLYKIQCSFRDKMNEVYEKHQKKTKLNQTQALTKVLQAFFDKKNFQKEPEQKLKQFQKVVYTDYPKVIFSPKIFAFILNSFEIEIMIHHTEIKIKKVCEFYKSQTPNSPSKLEQKLEKLNNQFVQKVNKLKQEENENKKTTCCTCGCNIALFKSNKYKA